MNYNSEQNRYTIDQYMDLYLKVKEKSNVLTEENNMLVGQTDFYISTLPENSEVKNQINDRIDHYYASTKEFNKKNLGTADELKQGITRKLVKVEDPIPNSSRAAFINIAILLYGMLNIGMIIAIAVMK